MSHKANPLSWEQDVATSPREFHETDNNRINSADLLATWQYFSVRHIRFSKLLFYQKLSKIILSYFSKALSFEQGKRSFQISGKLTSFAKIKNKKIARHFENHWCMTLRHTGSDQSTNVYLRDPPSLLSSPYPSLRDFFLAEEIKWSQCMTLPLQICVGSLYSLRDAATRIAGWGTGALFIFLVYVFIAIHFFVLNISQ